jgi:AcrR family transcriptional regulator
MSVSDTTAETRAKPGRPRDPKVDEAIFTATLELLAEEGYAQLTIERIAARAGVGKASLYRRWPDKASVVLEAVSRDPERPSAPDTGSLSGDVLDFLRTLVRYRTLHSEAIIAISSEALCNARFGEAFRAGMADPVLAGMRTIVLRAVARDELPANTDVDLVASLPPALLQAQRLLGGRQPDEAFAERIVAQFFSPCPRESELP